MQLSDVRRYLDRLRSDHIGRPNPKGLNVLHRSHVEWNGLCGCLLSLIDGSGNRTVRELTSAGECWGTVPGVFGLTLDDLHARDRVCLWGWLVRSLATRLRLRAEGERLLVGRV